MMEGLIVKNMSFKVGQTLTLVGKTNPDAKHFKVNIGPDEKNIAFHVNPRFDRFEEKKVVVCNSYQDGKWFEEKRLTFFPFELGKEFKISITFKEGEFLVFLQDSSNFTFPNRLGKEKYSMINFDGDARITRIEIS